MADQERVSDFHHITARLKLPLAPVFLTKPPLCKDDDKEARKHANHGPIEAVNQSIASLLMKYIPSLGSVLVSYLQPPVFILPDPYGCPTRMVADDHHPLPIPTVPGVGWGVIDVEVRLMGWRPTIGQKIIGRPTLSSPSHLSLVIYHTFNATIHENHLKPAGCRYDLNVPVPTGWENSENNDVAATEHNPWDPDSTEGPHRECGCWVDADGKVIGGDDGMVCFTVISLSVANHMISVVGSLLDDPFSVDAAIPDNTPIGGASALNQARAGSEDESSSEEEEERPNYRLNSKLSTKALTRIESPPPVKSTRARRYSRRLSKAPDDHSSHDEDDNLSVKPPVRNTRSRQVMKTPRKKKGRQPTPDDEDQLSSSPPTPRARAQSRSRQVIKTPAKKKGRQPTPDDEDQLASSPPAPPPPRATTSKKSTPAKRRQPSVKPKLTSSKKKLKSN